VFVDDVEVFVDDVEVFVDDVEVFVDDVEVFVDDVEVFVDDVLFVLELFNTCDKGLLGIIFIDNIGNLGCDILGGFSILTLCLVIIGNGNIGNLGDDILVFLFLIILEGSR